MRIAFISFLHGLPWGGSEELWFSSAVKALQEGHEVFVSRYSWENEHKNIQILKEKGATIHLRPRKKVEIQQAFLKRLLKKFKSVFLKEIPTHPYQQLIDFDPEVICINQGYCYELFNDYAFSNLINGFNYFIISHNSSDQSSLDYENRIKYKSVFLKANKLMFVSHRNKKTVERQLLHQFINAEVIQNPVNLPDFTYVKFPESETLKMACVAMLDCTYKGQDMLLETLSSELWVSRDWELNFYGAGHDKKYLEDLCVHYNIEKKVKFWGHVSGIKNIWEKNQLLILPSWNEGKPIALIEAMICGRAALVTDVGGNEEVLTDGKTGIICQNASLKSINDGLERIWNKKEQLKVMGEQARQSIMETLDFSPEQTLLDILISKS